MKQTAVEWLEEQMKTWGDLPRWMRDDIVKQAKEMEKAQIKNAYNSGWGVITDTATDYYKKTYDSKR